jgi:hypothetical protein
MSGPLECARRSIKVRSTMTTLKEFIYPRRLDVQNVQTSEMFRRSDAYQRLGGLDACTVVRYTDRIIINFSTFT